MSKSPSLAKLDFLFGNKNADGDGSMKPLPGGKDANLAATQAALEEAAAKIAEKK